MEKSPMHTLKYIENGEIQKFSIFSMSWYIKYSKNKVKVEKMELKTILMLIFSTLLYYFSPYRYFSPLPIHNIHT